MNESNNTPEEPLLKITTLDQYRTVEELFSHAKANSSYFLLLGLSTLIVTAGLLLNNSAIVIGGMLVTPLLTPILVIGLGVAVGEIKSITDTLTLILKSVLVIILASTILAFLFDQSYTISLFDNSLRTAMLYFLAAFASGIAGAFAWAKKEISEVLPGVAVAVSLVPPLSHIGIWLAAQNLDQARNYLLIFLFNLLGIILGGLVVFSLLKFGRVSKVVRQQAAAVKESANEQNKK